MAKKSTIFRPTNNLISFYICKALISFWLSNSWHIDPPLKCHSWTQSIIMLLMIILFAVPFFLLHSKQGTLNYVYVRSRSQILLWTQNCFHHNWSHMLLNLPNTWFTVSLHFQKSKKTIPCSTNQCNAYLQRLYPGAEWEFFFTLG